MKSHLPELTNLPREHSCNSNQERRIVFFLLSSRSAGVLGCGCWQYGLCVVANLLEYEFPRLIRRFIFDPTEYTVLLSERSPTHLQLCGNGVHSAFANVSACRPPCSSAFPACRSSRPRRHLRPHLRRHCSSDARTRPSAAAARDSHHLQPPPRRPRPHLPSPPLSLPASRLQPLASQAPASGRAC